MGVKLKLCVSENGLLPKSLDGVFRKIDCILDGVGRIAVTKIIRQVLKKVINLILNFFITLTIRSLSQKIWYIKLIV